MFQVYAIPMLISEYQIHIISYLYPLRIDYPTNSMLQCHLPFILPVECPFVSKCSILYRSLSFLHLEGTETETQSLLCTYTSLMAVFFFVSFECYVHKNDSRSVLLFFFCWGGPKRRRWILSHSKWKCPLNSYALVVSPQI